LPRKKIIEEKPLTIPEVKQLLEELGPGAGGDFFQRTYDYVVKFAKLGPEARELVDKLVAEFGVPEDIAVQIVNCMPGSVDELRVFLSGRMFLSREKLRKMLDLLDQYR